MAMDAEHEPEVDGAPRNDLPSPPPSAAGVHERIAGALASAGWCVEESFLSHDHAAALADEAWSAWQEGAFRHARVGTGSSLQLRPEVRRDHVLWLADDALTEAQRAYLDEIEKLRLAINERLFLGLFGYEGHFAVYPPGACYRKHLDQFQGARHRIVTASLYLNRDWAAAGGGALRLYLDPEDAGAFHDVVPAFGTLVTFLSARFHHEVLPSTRERLSLTGWFKVRTG